MSAYPSPLENLPTFSSSDFSNYLSSSLTLQQANLLYARIANSNIFSGLNTFSSGIVSANAQINDFLTVIGQASYTIPIQLPTLYSGNIATSSLMGYMSQASSASSVAMTSNTGTNIQDITIPVAGVWAIYHEYLLTCTSAGTISYINTSQSLTSGTGNITVSGKRQIHTPSVYALNDVEQYGNVFYYTTTTANTHIYLNAYLTFTAGAYTISSKSNIVRIA